MSTAQWANIGDDAGALHALVRRVAEHVAVAAIDYVWIFPARKVAAGESVVVVVAAFDEDPERRRVITARFTVSRNRKGAAEVKERFDEHGAAPADALPRIVQGVLRRLGEDADAEPRAERIAGESERWNSLAVELGGRPAADEHANASGEEAAGSGEAPDPAPAARAGDAAAADAEDADVGDADVGDADVGDPDAGDADAGDADAAAAAAHAGKASADNGPLAGHSPAAAEPVHPGAADRLP